MLQTESAFARVAAGDEDPSVAGRTTLERRRVGALGFSQADDAPRLADLGLAGSGRKPVHDGRWRIGQSIPLDHHFRPSPEPGLVQLPESICDPIGSERRILLYPAPLNLRRAFPL